MSEQLVSVITPTYNAACFLSQTIDSVRGQTYQNWEMLIVDDGSLDETLSIAKRYAAKDKRIKVLPLGYNSGGPATPRNYGMRKAKGSYIAFLDSDDRWLPQKLQRQVYILEENVDIFLLYSQCIVERDGKQLSIEPKNPKSGCIFNDLLYSNVIACNTVIMRNRKEKNSYFFDEDIRFVAVEDYAMWLLIAYKEQIFFLKEPLAVYRIHSKGIAYDAYGNFKKCGLVLEKFSHLVSALIRLKMYFIFYAKLAFVGIMVTLIKIKRFIVNKGRFARK